MVRIKSSFVLLITCSFLFTACGPSASELAETYVAQTLRVVTPTSVPSDTPWPSATALPSDTPTPSPSYTPTLVPTDTPIPTNTPTITPTPGPFSFLDDFSTHSEGWKDCMLCNWQDEALLMGPFLPGANFYRNYCTGCGVRSFYEISVDGTFVDGQVDRFFGVFVGDENGKQNFFGISPWQFYIIGTHVDEGDTWEIIDFQWSGNVHGSYETNHFKVTVKPAYQPNTADYLFSLNGSIVYVMYSRPVRPSRTGLAMDWHSMTVNYDNWKYVEIEP
jgi:hypothetical protein